MCIDAKTNWHPKSQTYQCQWTLLKKTLYYACFRKDIVSCRILTALCAPLGRTSAKTEIPKLCAIDAYWCASIRRLSGMPLCQSRTVHKCTLRNSYFYSHAELHFSTYIRQKSHAVTCNSMKSLCSVGMHKKVAATSFGPLASACISKELVELRSSVCLDHAFQTGSLKHPPTHPLTHPSLTHPLTHSVTHSTDSEFLFASAFVFARPSPWKTRVL